MKRIILLVAFVVSVIFSSSAQSFNADTRYIGAGVGMGGGIGIPVAVYYEQAVHEHIGVGATIGYAGKREDSWKYTYWLMGVRANYHFLEHIKEGTNWDTYGGLILGYNVASAKWKGSGTAPAEPSAGGFLFGGQVGARYCFNDSWAAFAEVGYGIGIVTVGANYSF